MERLGGRKRLLASARLHALGDEYTRTIEPARAHATEPLTLEREDKAKG